jgi:hypothetical protein
MVAVVLKVKVVVALFAAANPFRSSITHKVRSVADP